MTSGLLWYDNDPTKPVPQKVREAAARFEQKFGFAADRVYVNAHDLPDPPTVDGITVVPANNILRNHLWIGCDQG
jgi:hypothetical protein